MKHFWQFLIIAISWKYVGRRPIRFVTPPRVGAFHSPAIFAVLHWSFVFKHQTLLCFCLNLVTISVGRKSKDRSFWWHSLHKVNTSRRCVLNDQWRRYSNYSCTRIPVDGPPTRVRVSGSLLALLTYEYPGGYGLMSSIKLSATQDRQMDGQASGQTYGQENMTENICPPITYMYHTLGMCQVTEHATSLTLFLRSPWPSRSHLVAVAQKGTSLALGWRVLGTHAHFHLCTNIGKQDPV